MAGRESVEISAIGVIGDIGVIREGITLITLITLISRFTPIFKLKQLSLSYDFANNHSISYRRGRGGVARGGYCAWLPCPQVHQVFGMQRQGVPLPQLHRRAPMPIIQEVNPNLQ